MDDAYGVWFIYDAQDDRDLLMSINYSSDDKQIIIYVLAYTPGSIMQMMQNMVNN